jgi:hypothetical protein
MSRSKANPRRAANGASPQAAFLPHCPQSAAQEVHVSPLSQLPLPQESRLGGGRVREGLADPIDTCDDGVDKGDGVELALEVVPIDIIGILADGVGRLEPALGPREGEGEFEGVAPGQSPQSPGQEEQFSSGEQRLSPQKAAMSNWYWK